MARLIHIDWPDHGTPALPPAPDLAALRGRLAAARAAMAARGLDALAIYGDREHAANLCWLTGFDPRFEEALLILTPDAAHLLAGNECLPYTRISPLVVAGDIAVLHCPSLSLISQPRQGIRLADAIAQALPPGGTLGAAGWKYFAAGEVDAPETALDLPAFLADPLRARAARVHNATDLFMHPGYGLRCTVGPDDIARLEFANHMAASALRRMVFALREGMSDFAAVPAAGLGGLPLGCHVTFATGARAAQGMSGPTGQVLRRGQPVSFNICHWGANICRAGWLVSGPDDLPPDARDYLSAFAGPYVAAMSAWMEMMVPGTPGGDVWDRMMALLPHGTFGVTLNPGHLIGDDEWISSPIFAGSDLPLRSGMAMQSDVIPGHPVYGSTRMEDGFVISDEALRAALAAAHPDVAARCAARAAFMRDRLGLAVPEALLPLADTCGLVAPWLFDPHAVITL